MNRKNVLYWTVTVLFSALMIFSAIPGIMRSPDAVAMFETHLGYPSYFTVYLSVAKLVGALVLLVPRFPRVKEWAFAGFAFDLVSAMYSFASVGDPVASWAPLFIGLALLGVTYLLHHRRLAEHAVP